MDKSYTQLLITSLACDGKGVAPLGDSKVEVFTALPGDELLVELGKKRRRIYPGFLRGIVDPSPQRVKPRCKHVSSCGGCAWQQMDYAEQLKEKQRRIEALFSSFLEKDGALLHPILPCSTPWHYRNKMEYSFSQNREGEKFLGLVLADTKGRVFNLEECHLTNVWFPKTLAAVRAWWLATDLQAYHLHKNIGSLRTLTLREGAKTGDKMALLTVSGNPDFRLTKSQLDGFVEAVCRSLPESDHSRLSIFLRIQQIAKGSPTQFFELQLFGPDHIREELEIKNRRLTFKISPTSFFQPNTLQAEQLYTRALEMLQLSAQARVFDLYCGTATISMALAAEASHVIGIELNPHAVFDAEGNRELNGINNLEILCGDVGKVLTQLCAQTDFVPPDAVVVDPPRSGLDSLALSHILTLRPAKILYISCNPKTQAENIQILSEGGCRLTALQPVDQFPHTLHIENIALLERYSV